MAISLKRLHPVEPSPEARRLLWHVLSTGIVARDEPEQHEGYDKAGAFLFWVVGGRGTLEVQGSGSQLVFSLRHGARCWLLDLRRPRVYIPAPGCKLITNGVRFAGPGVEAWLDVLGEASEFRFHRPSGFAFIRRAKRQILELIKRAPRGYEWQVHLMLTQILGLLVQERGVFSKSPTALPKPVKLVLELVAADPCRRWKAQELADRSGISYSTLRALFKQSQGETLKQHLHNIQIEQARILLCDPRLLVKEVAQRLGFADVFYFSHFFRKATGLTPSQFRLQRLHRQQ